MAATKAPRILVVDDEPGMRDMLADALALASYETHTAVDGFDALKRIRAEKFDLHYEFSNSSAHLTFTPLVHFQMSGLGYLHPEWGHGFWKGELAVSRDDLSLPVEDPLAPHYLHVQTLSSVTYAGSDGVTHHGTGVLETLVIGAHSPSGFTGIIDGYQSK